MSEFRKLAAILAADVVGYSRLAGLEEDRTLARLRALRGDLVDPTIAVHNGRMVKRTGDGFLVEFRSVVQAVRCAIEIQNSMSERNAGVAAGRRIDFRIGVHLGDVVEESDGDLMGDGVNIAARLEGIAKPGAICLSEDAYRQVRARLDLAVNDLGHNQLKNIIDPIRVYSLEIGAPAPPPAPPRAASPKKDRSVLMLISASVVALAIFAGAWWAWTVNRGSMGPSKGAVETPAASGETKVAPPGSTLDELVRRGDVAYDARDYVAAMNFYRRAADHGSPEAQNAMGNLYRHALGVGRDYAEAVRWYQKAADQGYGWGEANLGDMYRDGFGVDRDYAEAMKWLRKAADEDNPEGRNGIGTLYQSGLGVARDDTEAVRWFRMSADQGFRWAEGNLGDMYRWGRGVKRDYGEAMRWYRKAADQGNAIGEDGIGLLYKSGLGVERDHAEAMRWFRKSADQGFAWGQALVGEMFREGSGVDRDYAEAMKWFRMAADQGNPDGQNGVGVLYDQGLGVAVDHAEALRWFRLAAYQNWPWAQMNIGYAYAMGRGVDKDCGAAKTWFAKASAAHDDGVDAFMKSDPVCGYPQ
jgi:TPR repeat protein/class 3 adenylate cyclase